MARLRVYTDDEWWLTYGDPSDNSDEDTAFLMRGVTQKELSVIVEKATKNRWVKNPKGEWVPKDHIDMTKFADELGPHIAGWRNLENAVGQPIPYTSELVPVVLNSPGVLGGLLLSINQLGKVTHEIVEAQLGN